MILTTTIIVSELNVCENASNENTMQLIETSKSITPIIDLSVVFIFCRVALNPVLKICNKDSADFQVSKLQKKFCSVGIFIGFRKKFK